MAKPLFPTYKRAAQKLKENPQLFYTIAVAVVIAVAFVFMANRFVAIANDAQERLINVRIGSLQDAFVSFAKDRWNDSEYLNRKIAEIALKNETIRDFRIIEKRTSADAQAAYAIVASNNPVEVGSESPQSEFLYSLALANPNDSVTMEYRYGDERLFRTARAVKGGAGEVLGAVITTQTLSLADQAIESDIAKSTVTLVAILALIMLLFLRHSRIIDYSALYKKLKEVDQLKDDFISMASHELRTPLSTIRGYAEFIREAPDLSPETRDYAAKIDLSAKDLDSLVADILDVSRIEQGRMSFNMESLDPREAVENSVSALARQAHEKGLSLSADASKWQADARISADKERLRQVLMNIVGNAVKYTKQGEVKVSLSKEGQKAVVRVSDTGIGMSADEQKRLFEKFYRIRTKDTEDIKGTGLGLWITAEIVREMSGSISVESIKGVGSHFIVSFPIIKST